MGGCWTLGIAWKEGEEGSQTTPMPPKGGSVDFMASCTPGCLLAFQHLSGSLSLLSSDGSGIPAHCPLSTAGAAESLSLTLTASFMLIQSGRWAGGQHLSKNRSSLNLTESLQMSPLFAVNPHLSTSIRDPVIHHPRASPVSYEAGINIHSAASGRKSVHPEPLIHSHALLFAGL